MSKSPSAKAYIISCEGRFWSVKVEDGRKPTAVRKSFIEALKAGRRLAIRQRRRLLIQAPNGEVREADPSEGAG